MKLQVATTHAIRVLQYLHENEDELHTATAIAKATGITYPFLIKLANQLKKKGLLRAVQGRNGGYALGQSANQISIYDVYMCIEGDLQIHFCGEQADDKVHEFLSVMQEGLVTMMSNTAIADLAS
ncbi:MAG: Rrf2 family transcriptional regulator [Oscillospiraceae bacterium]|nr:Rrf2 family transcriptional regulator [Oscillospiraceae bacterium]